MTEPTPEIWDLSEVQHQAVTTALFAYWTSRADAREAQIARGTLEIGGRGGVTAGNHLDQVASLIANVCVAIGAPVSQVFFNAPANDPLKRVGIARGYTLPGFFRPTKSWDVVVYCDGEPIVVVELKSQNGPSYGNNANNRAEEAMGSIVDLNLAINRGLIPGSPWLGYVFVIEDDLDSQQRNAERSSVQFSTDPLFDGWSYVSRVKHLCQRLLEEDLYSATWAVATSRPDCPGPATATKKARCPLLRRGIVGAQHVHKFDWRELDPAVSGWVRFVNSLSERIEQYYPS